MRRVGGHSEIRTPGWPQTWTELSSHLSTCLFQHLCFSAGEGTELLHLRARRSLGYRRGNQPSQQLHDFPSQGHPVGRGHKSQASWLIWSLTPCYFVSPPPNSLCRALGSFPLPTAAFLKAAEGHQQTLAEHLWAIPQGTVLSFQLAQ